MQKLGNGFPGWDLGPNGARTRRGMHGLELVQRIYGGAGVEVGSHTPDKPTRYIGPPMDLAQHAAERRPFNRGVLPRLRSSRGRER
jgi:hypothetical protein